MSGEGAPVLAADGAHDLRVGVVTARWHRQITDGLRAGALAALAEMGVREPVEVSSPGAFEVPLLAAALARAGCDAVVCLAAVIRGATPHFDHVARAVTDGCARVALETGVPMGFGVLTCDDEAQARDRAGLPGSLEDKGREAAQAAVATAVALRAISDRGC